MPPTVAPSFRRRINRRAIVLADMADGETSYVAWAYRLNQRWIVHHGLDQRAKAYMDHLAGVDPRRLERSCQFAHQLARQAAPEDPKPWFYAGLFSLATAEEAGEFLANHWFTRSAIPSLTAELCSATAAGAIGQAARDKIARIRQALSCLLASAQDAKAKLLRSGSVSRIRPLI